MRTSVPSNRIRARTWLALLLAPTLASAAPPLVPPGAVATPPHYISQAQAMATPPPAGDRGHHHHGGGWRGGWGRGVPFVYTTMVASQSGDAAAADDGGKPPPRVEYVPVPYPVPMAPPPPPKPKAPTRVARYAVDGQPIDIPHGARVTTGEVFRYQSGGVSVYTDTPPANAHATRLFGYTEAVVQAPGGDR